LSQAEVCPAVSNLPPAAPAVSTDEAAAILRRGGLVAFPTETVYGLGADARSPEALARLYKVKGRPAGHPVIVHIASVSQLSQWAREVPEFALKLAERFWPGPLTLVLKRAPDVADAVTGGQDTVGLRVPAHPSARALLEAFGGGIAAPSANRFGRLSPTAPEHVRADLGGDIDAIVEDGSCDVGIESTIVDCSGDVPILLRPGKITAAEIEAVAGVPLAESGTSSSRAPGTLPAHYAPRAKLKLLRRTEIIEAVSTNKGKRLAALLLEIPVPRLPASQVIVVPAVATSYARALYANLRLLDATHADVILVESPPEAPTWTAILDRLKRAAHVESVKPQS
jgi:L-threonylcarbamoyladenylate synthase